VTVCVNGADVDVFVLISPAYCTVIECEPTASDDVENDAVPLDASATVASAVAPSKNVTLPVSGTTLTAGVTTVENVT
jgi:hypothetical protein